MTTQKKQAGKKIDSADVRKHKNDVFRLWVLLTQESRIALPASVRTDLKEFIAQMHIEPSDLTAFGISVPFPNV